MIEIINLTPRSYQQEIFETSKEKNTLVCLPTGTGKTLNIVLLSIYRLNKIQDSKVAIISPTKPLSAQHFKTFKEYTNINENEIALVTGQIKPEKRIELYNKRVIIATPQTLREDIINNRFSFKSFSLLAVDECHRAIGNYAYTFLTKAYLQQSEFPRIIALTASPGSSKEKIEEIKKNLSIEAVEIRTEEDIKEHIQEKQVHWLEVELSAELKEINELIKKAYKEKLSDLKKLGYTKPISVISKKDLIQLQQHFRRELSKKSPTSYYGISLTALLIKIDYASELLETQGIKPLIEFFEKLKLDKTKAAKIMSNLPEIQKAVSLTRLLAEKGIKHPKLYMLKGVVRKELEKNPTSKAIIFANYRSTIDEILTFLNNEEKIRATKLIGQKSGLTQKEQIETIKKFEEGTYNMLVTSSIGEEGLHISGPELAIFYDIVPSEIRTQQRKGRVGRTKAGKIIFLATKNTREQGYKWSTYHKGKKMQEILKKMQEKTKTLSDF